MAVVYRNAQGEEQMITSEGEKANYPRFLLRHEKKLARLYRWHSRRKLGNRNRERMRRRVCLEYEKITNQRVDYLRKKSYNLAEEYDAVYIETMNMANNGPVVKVWKSVSEIVSVSSVKCCHINCIVVRRD